MGFNPGAIRRQDVDIYDLISYGYTTTAVGGVLTGGNATVVITVPGVTLPANGALPNSQTWFPLAVWTSQNIGNLLINAFVSGTNQVTFILHNNSGGTITPPANTAYGVIMARLHQRFTTPNLAGGSAG